MYAAFAGHLAKVALTDEVFGEANVRRSDDTSTLGFHLYLIETYNFDTMK